MRSYCRFEWTPVTLLTVKGIYLVCPSTGIIIKTMIQLIKFIIVINLISLFTGLSELEISVLYLAPNGPLHPLFVETFMAVAAISLENTANKAVKRVENPSWITLRKIMNAVSGMSFNNDPQLAKDLNKSLNYVEQESNVFKVDLGFDPSKYLTSFDINRLYFNNILLLVYLINHIIKGGLDACRLYQINILVNRVGGPEVNSELIQLFTINYRYNSNVSLSLLLNVLKFMKIDLFDNNSSFSLLSQAMINDTVTLQFIPILSSKYIKYYNNIYNG